MRQSQKLAGLFFALGALWRLDFVFRAHPATRYVYSDMQGYHEWAKRFFDPGATQSIADTFHPPGAAIYLGFLHALDASWAAALGAQWVLSCGTLGLVYLLAKRLYGTPVATVSLAMASGYYPFVHYAGFFLMENPFTFCVCLIMWGVAKLLAATSPRRMTAWACLVGLLIGVAASLKNSILGSMVVLGFGLVVLGRKRPMAHVAWILLATTLGAALMFVPMSVRCTKLNEGRFCLASNNTACNVLMGHYGRKGLFRWHDRQRHIEIQFGSPTSFLNGWNTPVDLDFGVYESAKNWALARDYIVAHPLDALLESGRHVFDLFFGRTLWPSADEGPLAWGAIAQILFWWLVLLPAAAWLAVRWRALLAGHPSAQAEWLLVLPVLGLMATVFISVSEVRYRVPFDGLLIILAARGHVFWFSHARRALKPRLAAPQPFGG